MFELKQYASLDFCKRCFGCCRFKERESIWLPHLLEEEQKFLKIKKIKLKFKENYFICSFLEEKNNRCKIYKFRPFECQLYPFLIQHRKDKLFLAVHLSCPLVKGRISCKDFRDYLNYLKDFFKKPEVLKTIIKNKEVFSFYPEDEIKEFEILGC